jgi:hypothetical protein
MASFETDLARYLDAYDREACAEENTRSEFGDDYRETYAYAGEDATLIPEDLVTESSQPGVFTYAEAEQIRLWNEYLDEKRT